MIDIQKLAELARLLVPEAERQGLLKDMEAIVGFVDQVKSRQVEGSVFAGDSKNILREDVVAPLSAAHDIVSAAPDRKGRFVKVPKVIDPPR